MGLFCFPDTRLKRLQNTYKLACDLVAILLPGPLNIGKNESDMGFETKYLCGSSFEQKMVFWMAAVKTKQNKKIIKVNKINF